MFDHSTTDLIDETQRALRAMLPPSNDASPKQAMTYRFEDFSDAAPVAVQQADETQLDLRIELGRTRLSPDDARLLRAGSVVSLDGRIDEPVDIRVGGRRIGRGEVVVVGRHLGVRVTELVEG